MHERTRRNLCRLAFLAFGFLPTACSLTWLAYRATPWFAAAERSEWEARLFAVTGLLAQVGSVEHPANRSTLLHAVTLTDPDGGDRVGTVRQLEIDYQPEGIVVLLSQPEIAQGKFLRLWDTLHDRVLKGKSPPMAVQIVCGEITIAIGHRAQTFTALRCTVEPRETGPRAWFDFQLAGITMSTPARIQIDRNRQLTPAMTQWSFQTETPLPCALFADYAPALDRLGPAATFAGIVNTTHGRNGWSSELTGRFAQVALDRLTDSLPHKLSGSASIGLQQVRIESGVVIEASGDVVSPGGTIGMSLVSSLAQRLPVAVPEVALASHAELSSYDQLAFRFTVDSGGLLLIGTCQASQRGAMLMSHGQPFLSSEPSRPVSPIAFVDALYSVNQSAASSNASARALLSWLRSPASPQSETSTAASPRSRLRLSDR